jgi:NAD(P)-dependent dehydrogenase (short-subunit alcohol dehydrogenase family)
MSSLTIVIVGATSGVGRATATRLAHDGHHVLGIGRDPDRARTLERKLISSGGSATSIDVASARGWDTVTNWVSGQTRRVDVLVNAAGVILPQRQTTTDGLELNFAIHHLAPFAITSRLLTLLRAGAVPDGPGGRALPRVININSAGHQTSLGGHHNPTLDFDDLQALGDYNPFLAYSRTKLANLLFTYELTRRHGDELAIAALHPGVVRTNIGRNYPRIRVAAIQALAISPSRAARSVTALASEPLPRNGEYYDQHTPTRSSPHPKLRSCSS